MKKNQIFIHRNGCVFMSQVVSAQTSEWKEKTEFHKVMSKHFIPAEEGNFAPD